MIVKNKINFYKNIDFKIKRYKDHIYRLIMNWKKLYESVLEINNSLTESNIKITDKNKELLEEVDECKKEIEELKARLKKYINPDSKKKYYEKNREKINKKNIEYQKKK